MKNIFHCKENQLRLHEEQCTVFCFNLKQCETAFTGAEYSENPIETGHEKTRKQIEERQLQIASFSDDYVRSNLS